jgi:hypothetical protein
VRITLIDEKELEVEASVVDGEVSVSAADLQAVTGWELKPEGLCRGPVCVPFRGDVSLGTVASALGRSFVFDEEGAVGAFAGDPMSSGATSSIDELELPDMDGNIVRMSDFAGRKRLLIAWASW